MRILLTCYKNFDFAWKNLQADGLIFCLTRCVIYEVVLENNGFRLPVESEGGRGFISLSTIFWCSARRLKGSTVNGRVPVSIAYMFTPLQGQNTHFSYFGFRTDEIKMCWTLQQLVIFLQKMRVNSHGPDVHFGPILLPGEQLRGGVGRTSTLGAERIRVAQDAGAVAKAKIWAKTGGVSVAFRFITAQSLNKSPHYGITHTNRSRLTLWRELGRALTEYLIALRPHHMWATVTLSAKLELD